MGVGGMNKFEVKVIYEPDNYPVADIIFLHGLGGSAIDTWTHSNGGFWPNWLAKEAPKLRILTVNHPSEKLASLFNGSGMSIADRSKSTLELLDTYDLGHRPTIFVTHSLGGLITKGLLRKAHSVGGEKYEKVLDNIAGVIFLATPHKGSALANVISKIPAIPSKISKNLKTGTDNLKELQDWYVQRASERKIKTKAFSEAYKTSGLLVVPQESAHPGTLDGEPTSVDSNHTEICKFEDENDATYRMVRKFIFDCLRELQLDPTNTSNPSDFDYYTSTVEGDRKTLKEKLEEGKRSDEVKMALREKERIAEELLRNALSPTDQSAYKNFLGDIVSRFRLAVSPHINEGKSIAEVNDRLQKAVIDQVKTTQHKLATQEDIHAAVYYLTGNCHIWWSGQSND